MSTSRPSWCAPTRRSTSTSLSPRPTAEAGPAATSGSRSPRRVAEAAAAATTRIWSKRSIRRSVDCHSGSVSFVDRARSVSRITFLKQTRLHVWSVHRLARAAVRARGCSGSGVQASGGICYISRVRMCAVHAKGTLYGRTSFQNLTVGCAPLACESTASTAFRVRSHNHQPTHTTLAPPAHGTPRADPRATPCCIVHRPTVTHRPRPPHRDRPARSQPPVPIRLRPPSTTPTAHQRHTAQYAR